VRNFVVDVVDVAAKLRLMSNQTGPPYSIPMLVSVAFPGAVVTGRALPPGVDEIVTVTDDGALIIYRRQLSTAMQRFVIAHAIAHLIFDADALGVRPGLPFDVEREARADEFAAELLAPTSKLAHHIECLESPPEGDEHEAWLDKLDRMATVFHVPPHVIAKQIRRLNRQAKS